MGVGMRSSTLTGLDAITRSLPTPLGTYPDRQAHNKGLNSFEHGHIYQLFVGRRESVGELASRIEFSPPSCFFLLPLQKEKNSQACIVWVWLVGAIHCARFAVARTHARAYIESCGSSLPFVSRETGTTCFLLRHQRSWAVRHGGYEKHMKPRSAPHWPRLPLVQVGVTNYLGFDR